MFDDVNAAAEDLSVALDALVRFLSDASEMEDVTVEQSVEFGDLSGIVASMEQDWVRVSDRIDRLTR